MENKLKSNLGLAFNTDAQLKFYQSRLNRKLSEYGIKTPMTEETIMKHKSIQNKVLRIKISKIKKDCELGALFIEWEPVFSSDKVFFDVAPFATGYTVEKIKYFMLFVRLGANADAID